jgi:3-methyladenine DNA glycosylase/8-oxoguanine DNA glycosylase
MTEHQRRAVRRAVCRMLRLEEDLSGFHERCRASASHRRAADLRFGRLLRSTTLFEDMVKVICTCNVAWPQTVAMVSKLTAAYGVPSSDEWPRGFPTPRRLARVREAALRRTARVGYRAEFLHRLARDIDIGRLDLHAIEHFEGPGRELSRRLRRIAGIGEYAAAHLCMLLGRYDQLPVDTELKRFLQERYPRRRFTPAAIRGCYDHWHPYQFLAYWYELWSGYTDRHGHAEDWQPDGTGRRITSRRPGA